MEAVGIGAAGFVDKARSVVIFAPNILWRDEPLRERVQAQVDLPVVVENDANAAAWAEFRFGAGEDVDDLVLLTVGTGIGGGIVLDGELYRGAYGVAAEVGHLRVVPQGVLCGCGNRGCWEQYASGRALVRDARELVQARGPGYEALAAASGGVAERVDGPTVTRLAREGDPASVALVAEVGRWLGEGLASLTAVLDPAVAVVGGGVAAAGDLLLGPMRTAFEAELTAHGYRPHARDPAGRARQRGRHRRCRRPGPAAARPLSGCGSYRRPSGTMASVPLLERLSIGIDIGGTRVKAGVVDPDGNVVDRTGRDTPTRSPTEVEDTIADIVRELRSRHTVVGVGIGAAGFVDITRSTVLFSPHLAWRHEPLRDAVYRRIGLSVIVENDANAAAWAEFRFGAAQREDDLICITLGTGIGGAIMIGGLLYRGRHGMAGEFGHMQVVPQGHPCECGNLGCWEQYASGNALVRDARRLIDEGSPVRGGAARPGGRRPGRHHRSAGLAGRPLRRPGRHRAAPPGRRLARGRHGRAGGGVRHRRVRRGRRCLRRRRAAARPGARGFPAHPHRSRVPFRGQDRAGPPRQRGRPGGCRRPGPLPVQPPPLRPAPAAVPAAAETGSTVARLTAARRG